MQILMIIKFSLSLHHFSQILCVWQPLVAWLWLSMPSLTFTILKLFISLTLIPKLMKLLLSSLLWSISHTQICYFAPFTAPFSLLNCELSHIGASIDNPSQSLSHPSLCIIVEQTNPLSQASETQEQEQKNIIEQNKNNHRNVENVYKSFCVILSVANLLSQLVISRFLGIFSNIF